MYRYLRKRPYRFDRVVRRVGRSLYWSFRHQLITLLVAGGVGLLMVQWPLAKPPQPAVSSAPVAGLIGRASIIDGDTIEIRGQRIRLWGVDAPESAQICTRDGKPWQCGRDAALVLSGWVGTRTVECQERDRDRYRRIVALCRVGGVDVSAWLVENGWALAFRRYSGNYVANEDRARSAQRGIWVSQFQAPWDWRADRR